MSLHTTMKPWSRVALWLMRSQRPSASSTSPVACGSPLRQDRTRPAVTEFLEGRAQFAKRRAWLQQLRGMPRKSAACGLASAMQSSASTTTTPSCELSSASARRVCAERLLRDFAFHHGLDVVAHRSHGGEQRAQFVGAAFRDDDVELAGGDALGDPGRSRDRPHDAPRQRPRHHRRQQQRQHCADNIEIQVARNRRARRLPVEEAVARRVVDQQIDLLVAPCGCTGRACPSWRRAWCRRACARACSSRRRPARATLAGRSPGAASTASAAPRRRDRRRAIY